MKTWTKKSRAVQIFCGSILVLSQLIQNPKALFGYNHGPLICLPQGSTIVERIVFELEIPNSRTLWQMLVKLQNDPFPFTYLTLGKQLKHQRRDSASSTIASVLISRNLGDISLQREANVKNIAKGTTDPRVEFISQFTVQKS